MKKRNRCAGFSLLELLIASLLTVVISGWVLGITRTILINWNRATERFMVEETAWAALSLLEEDMVAWMEGPGHALLIRCEEIGPVGPVHSIRFFSGKSDSAFRSAGVGFCLYWLDVSPRLFGGDGGSHFFRGYLESEATWRDFYIDGAARTLWDPLSEMKSLFNEEDAFLLPHCLGLRIQPWIIGPQGEAIALEGKGKAGVALQKEGDSLAFPFLDQGRVYSMPAYVDVTLWMLTAEGGRLLGASRAEGTAMEGGPDMFYRMYAVSVTKRIVFLNQGF